MNISIYLSDDCVKTLIHDAEADASWPIEDRREQFDNVELDDLILVLSHRDADNRFMVTQRQLDWIMAAADTAITEMQG